MGLSELLLQDSITPIILFYLAIGAIITILVVAEIILTIYYYIKKRKVRNAPANQNFTISQGKEANKKSKEE